MRQFLYMIADELKEQLATSAELHRLGRVTDNHWSQGNALFLMSNVHRLQGRVTEALSDIREAMAITKVSEHPLWKQSKCYFRMDLYLAAGDMSLSEHFANLMYTQQDRLIPMFQSTFLNSVARVKIACGKLDEGEEILDRVLALCS
jgi:hypothetical protein